MKVENGETVIGVAIGTGAVGLEPKGTAFTVDSLTATEGFEFDAALDGDEKVVGLELHADVLVDPAGALDVANAFRVVATQTFEIPE